MTDEGQIFPSVNSYPSLPCQYYPLTRRHVLSEPSASHVSFLQPFFFLSATQNPPYQFPEGLVALQSVKVVLTSEQFVRYVRESRRKDVDAALDVI